MKENSIKKITFAEACKDKIKFWDKEKNIDISPEKITQFSDKMIWWKCEHGHSFCARAYNVSRGRWCPVCAGKKIIIGFNDLLTTHPELVEEWNQTDNELHPTEVSKGSKYDANWVCKKCGHKWTARVCNRVHGSGCPKCNRNKK